MKTFLLLLTALLVACGQRPGGGNISYVKSYEELDQFVGQDVLYCAKALSGKEPQATNGKIILDIKGYGSLKADKVYYFQGKLVKLPIQVAVSGDADATPPVRYALETD